jgi:hypothetical protein
MNAATQPASAFTSHLLASAKTEWSINVDGTPFVLVRTEPDTRPSWLVNPSKPVEVVNTWTLFVLADNGERVEVAHESGMRMNVDPTDGRPSVAEHTAYRLARLTAAARNHVEGMAHLAMMLDDLMANAESNAPKVRKIRDAAALALRFHRVIKQRDSVLALVAGEAVLIVSKNERSGEWTQLAYRINDRAAHGSYNLVYTGTITSISPKTITVIDRHGQTTKRMTHENFVRYNDQPIEAADKRNAEWMD